MDFFSIPVTACHSLQTSAVTRSWSLRPTLLRGRRALYWISCVHISCSNTQQNPTNLLVVLDCIRYELYREWKWTQSEDFEDLENAIGIYLPRSQASTYINVSASSVSNCPPETKKSAPIKFSEVFSRCSEMQNGFHVASSMIQSGVGPFILQNVHDFVREIELITENGWLVCIS
jgi:hypothetical protein